MPEKSNVLSQDLKHKGFFNYSEFYTFCYEWFLDRGYLLSEDNYTEKISNFGKEVIIKWTARKKVSDYFRNVIEVKWHILGMTDEEVQRDGKKEKANKGEVKLSVKADLERDYEKRWEDKPFWKFLRGIYDKYIVRTTIEDYEERLFHKATEFIEDAKGFLVLEGKK